MYCTIFPEASPGMKVFVLDFPPLLCEEPDYQDLMRQEFHRVAVRLGVRYLSIAEHFHPNNSQLWCRDGIHLNNDYGMPRFVDLLWCASYLRLYSVTEPLTSPEPAPRMSTVRVTPRVLVSGTSRTMRHCDPSAWSVVKHGVKESAEYQFKEMCEVQIQKGLCLVMVCVGVCVVVNVSDVVAWGKGQVEVCVCVSVVGDGVGKVVV
ncbi:uncharacterized protein LOC121697246 [Alosa sapidissima]|uniref:uncharacterized protein LOC121697246 n=1 Tax=Alosa sapidissima TaxID=34773 RepID=UPI001C090603|nr:uncharacterized protein LOC121697246 [Alosa sapidissima]